MQDYLGGWAQAIALYVRPEDRRNRVASHLLRIAKRTLVEQATPSLGLIGKAAPSETTFWAKVSARFYFGRENPDEAIFAITWARRDACGDLLSMFSRSTSHPRGDGILVGEGDDDSEIPF